MAINRIETCILNISAVKEAEKNMVFAARLTQRGHQIETMEDLLSLYAKPYGSDTLKVLSGLPHPTIQKFAVITVAVVGASRRFLAQATRHQNEVKFMSASLQYSNYSGSADFVVPYEILKAPCAIREFYLQSCKAIMECYARLCSEGIGHDSAGYAAPQSLRNVLIISATPYQWKHMIGQRTCRRNTDETRYVMLKVWTDLYGLSPALFAPELTGPFCQREMCREGKMTCGREMEKNATPLEVLKTDFPILMKTK